jgi:mannan endo-1,4-beta-mannosidase
MRWPNREPHTLTPGMRRAQAALAGFLPLVDWPRFRRRPLDAELAGAENVHLFACGDGRQAVVYLLRGDTIGPDGRLAEAAPLRASVTLPRMEPGRYRATAWDTRSGRSAGSAELGHPGGTLRVGRVRVATDLVLALRRVADA